MAKGPALPDISSLLAPKDWGTILFYGAASEPLTDTWTVTVPVVPFSADDEAQPSTFRSGVAGPDIVETSFQFDFIVFDGALSVAELEGRSFTFPVSPENNYVDASIYLCHRHNPIDVTKIHFGVSDGDTIPASIECHVDFGFEAVGAADFDTTITTRLRSQVWESRQ